MNPTADARTGRKAYADCRRDCRNLRLGAQERICTPVHYNIHPRAAPVKRFLNFSNIKMSQIVTPPDLYFCA